VVGGVIVILDHVKVQDQAGAGALAGVKGEDVLSIIACISA